MSCFLHVVAPNKKPKSPEVPSARSQASPVRTRGHGTCCDGTATPFSGALLWKSQVENSTSLCPCSKLPLCLLQVQAGGAGVLRYHGLLPCLGHPLHGKPLLGGSWAQHEGQTQEGFENPEQFVSGGLAQSPGCVRGKDIPDRCGSPWFCRCFGYPADTTRISPISPFWALLFGNCGLTESRNGLVWKGPSRPSKD